MSTFFHVCLHHFASNTNPRDSSLCNLTDIATRSFQVPVLTRSVMPKVKKPFKQPIIMENLMKFHSKKLAKLREKIKEEAFDDKLLSSKFGPQIKTFRAASPKGAKPKAELKACEFDIEAVDCDSDKGAKPKAC